MPKREKRKIAKLFLRRTVCGTSNCFWTWPNKRINGQCKISIITSAATRLWYGKIVPATTIVAVGFLFYLFAVFVATHATT